MVKIKEKDNFYYEEYKDGVKIIGYCGDLTDFIQIPEAIDGKNVVALGSTCKYSKVVEKIKIPKCVSEIDLDMFREYDLKRWARSFELDDESYFFAVKDDVLFSKDMKILYYAFLQEGQREYIIPDEVEVIYNKAFKNRYLENVIFTDNLKEIGDYAFDGNFGLENVKLPLSIEKIGSYSFDVSIDINSSIKYLGNNFASRVGSISSDNKEFEVFNNFLMTKDHKRLLKYVGDSSLKKIEIPKGVEIIDDCAFNLASYATSVKFNDEIKFIGKDAFKKTKIRTVKLPNSIEKFDIQAFKDNVKISIDKNCKNYEVDDIAIYRISNDGKKYAEILINKGITEYTLPEGVVAIDDNFFKEASKLSKINLNSVIEDFDTGLLDETAVKKIYFPKNVKNITFHHNEAINYSFSEDSDYYFKDDNLIYKILDDEKYILLFTQDKGALKVDINEGTVEIDSYAFDVDFCDSSIKTRRLVEVNFPSSLRIINDYALRNTKIKTLKIPEGVEEIGYSAFKDNKNLVTVYLPSTLKFLDPTAFNGCLNIKSITFPNGNDNFKVIDDVIYSSDMKELIYYPPYLSNRDFKIPEGVSNITTAFSYNKKIRNLYIPKSLKNLFENAFRYSSIDNIFFEDDMNYISDDAFYSENRNVFNLHYKYDSYIGKYVDKSIERNYSHIKVDLVYDNMGEELKKYKNIFDIILVDDGYKIIRYIGNESTVKIPDTIDGIPVVKIGECAFNDSRVCSIDGHNKIEKIFLSKNIKRIDAYTFCDVSSLKEVYIPSSVEFIDDKFFTYSSSGDDMIDAYFRTDLNFIVDRSSYAEKYLKSFKINPDRGIFQLHVSYIDEKPSIYDSTLSAFEFNINENDELVVSLADEWFNSYDKLYIPEKVNDKPVTVIDFNRRFLSKYVTSLVISKNIEKILFSKYDFAPGLKNIEVDSENMYYSSENNILYDKNKKKVIKVVNKESEEFIIPSSVEEIGQYAFAGLENLKKIVINSKIKYIGEYAFYESNNLEVIDGIENIQDFSEEAFCETAFLQKNNNLIINHNMISIANDVCEYVVPEGVTKLNKGLFIHNNHIRKVILPNSLEKIGDLCFRGCNELEEINLPKNLKEIGDRAFLGCSNIKEIFIPKSVVSIGVKAFYLSEMRELATEKLVVDDDNCYFSSENNMLYSKDKSILYYSIPNKEIEILSLPETLKEIRDYAFSRNKYLKEIIFNSKIENFGSSIFSDCVNLKSIRFYENQEYLEKYMFRDCTSLESILWPKNIKYISESCFKNCSNLNITLPESLEEIEECAFADCNFKEIEIPKSVKKVGMESFRGTKSIIVYDSLDPDAKDCSEGIDDLNGYPNSMLGFVGIGEAFAKAECAANHKWLDYTITVKSALDNTIKYKVWMGADSSQRQYYCTLSSGWGKNATFNFKRLDLFFDKIRGLYDKLVVSIYRLVYPVDLTDEYKKVYIKYFKRNIMNVLMFCVDNQDEDLLNYLKTNHLISSKDVAKLKKEYSNLESTKFIERLMDGCE